MRVVEINEQTKLPLGLVAGLVCTLVGGVFWLTMLYADVAQAKRDIAKVEAALSVLNDMKADIAEVKGAINVLSAQKEDAEKK